MLHETKAKISENKRSNHSPISNLVAQTGRSFQQSCISIYPNNQVELLLIALVFHTEVFSKNAYSSRRAPYF